MEKAVSQTEKQQKQARAKKLHNRSIQNTHGFSQNKIFPNKNSIEQTKSALYLVEFVHVQEERNLAERDNYAQ